MAARCSGVSRPVPFSSRPFCASSRAPAATNLFSFSNMKEKHTVEVKVAPWNAQRNGRRNALVDQPVVAGAGGDVQRRDAAGVAGPGVGAVPQQRLHRLVQSQRRGQVQQWHLRSSEKERKTTQKKTPSKSESILFDGGR